MVRLEFEVSGIEFTPLPGEKAIQERATQASAMPNHFTGLSLGPPLGDQRLDFCDLYAFQSPADSSGTTIILNANPNADALYPDAIDTRHPVTPANGTSLAQKQFYCH